MSYARKQVETELNGVGDNPIFLPDAIQKYRPRFEAIITEHGVIDPVTKERIVAVLAGGR